MGGSRLHGPRQDSEVLEGKFRAGTAATPKLQERLAKLSGGVAVIRIGAATEAEAKSRKEALEDARAASAHAQDLRLPGAPARRMSRLRWLTPCSRKLT